MVGYFLQSLPKKNVVGKFYFSVCQVKTITLSILTIF